MRPLAAVVLIATCVAAAPARAQIALLVSRNSAGQAADSHSYRPAISNDGRWVAFDSWAGNLAAGVDVANSGVYLRDVHSGATRLASASHDGSPPDDKSYMADISGDGRFVAFWSRATNLVAGDTNGDEDVFVYDRIDETVVRVNLGAGGVQAEDADDGSHIVTDPPAVSGDGRWVAFDTRAGNLVPDDTNDTSDVFVVDRQTGAIERISVQSDGAQALAPSTAPSISDDGRWVAFRSMAPLTPDDVATGFDVYLYDRTARTLQRVGPTFGGGPSLSGDGRWVAFESLASDLVAGDTNDERDVFLFDRQAATVERVSVASDGAQGNDDSSEPSVSADGRWVAFRSGATNLVAPDGNDADDVFLRDRQTGTTMRLSVTPAGVQSTGLSREPAVSADGYFTAFESAGTNLAGGDDNFGAVDVFLAVTSDTCPSDPVKLFPGGCGCGTRDLDGDGDAVPDCIDACPLDAKPAVDGDADGAPDCHDPSSVADLEVLVRAALGIAQRLNPRTGDHDELAAQLRQHAASMTAALNNAAFSAKLKKLMRKAATAAGGLGNASARAMNGKRRKAVAALTKLLKALRPGRRRGGAS
jgi:Tol biopolymer transport system component